MPSLIQPAPHEFDAQINFSYESADEQDSRLRPFWAVEHTVRDVGGSTSGSVEIEGTEYDYTLYYQESGIESLNHDSEQVDTIREFRIKWELSNDSAGQCDGSFHIRPRTPQMVDSEGNSINSPEGFVGVNVRMQGSNLPFRDYLPLFRGICQSLGLSRRYWRDKHIEDSSNITDAEYYVRLEREESGSLHAVDGPISRISKLMSTDRSGYRKHVADDTQIEGFYHTATIGSERARELIKLHNLPKEIKHYYGKHPQHTDDSHPTHYPKLGVSYQHSLDGDTLYWEQLERLERELEEVLLNVLDWADLPIEEEDVVNDTDGIDENPFGRLDDAPGPYVDDAYFRAKFEHRQRRLVSNPTPEIEANQDSVLVRTLADGLTDSDLDTLETLVTDGGSVSPSQVANEQGWHLDTIYQCIERLEGIVEHSYGDLSLRSHYVAEKVTEAVREAREAGRDALEIAGQALSSSDRLERNCDALTEWLDSNGVSISERDEGQMILRAGEWDSLDELQSEIDNLVHLWRSAGFEISRLLDARLDFRADGFAQVSSVKAEKS